MSDNDDDITHVFDQTNGVLDGFEGESDGSSEAATAGAAERRGDAEGGDHAVRTDDGGADTSPLATADSDAGGPVATAEEEHAYAVDSRGTATDVDDGAAATSAGDGTATAVAANSASAGAVASGSARATETAEPEPRPTDAQQSAGPEDVQRSQVAEPRADHDHDHDGHEHHDHDGHDHRHDDHDHDHAVPVVDSDEPASGAAAGSGLGALAGDDSIAHVFDQTNGVVEGVEGESDGSAEGDEASAADRHGLNEPNPVGQQDAFHDDHYGAEDGRDPNP